ISFTKRTAGTSTVAASIDNSSQSRDGTVIADVRTAQIAILEVTQDNSVATGTTSHTPRVPLTASLSTVLASPTTSVT
ncbi:hypothetical protein ACAF96_26895, partial [Escherichia coli]|uniref:hypothetical protein n=1 Tax=Escherichia coli TaxID=562 RepID=UPI003F9FF984